MQIKAIELLGYVYCLRRMSSGFTNLSVIAGPLRAKIKGYIFSVEMLTYTRSSIDIT